MALFTFKLLDNQFYIFILPLRVWGSHYENNSTLKAFPLWRDLFQRDFSIFHSSTTRFIHLVAPKFYPLFCVYKYLGEYLCLLLNGRRNSWKPYLAHMWAATSSLSAFEQLQKWKLHINSINQCYTTEQHFVTALL